MRCHLAGFSRRGPGALDDEVEFEDSPTIEVSDANEAQEQKRTGRRR